MCVGFLCRCIPACGEYFWVFLRAYGIPMLLARDLLVLRVIVLEGKVFVVVGGSARGL